jgi:DNA-binding beta-propeller fold protein YncE/WD40 repeat protein
MTIPGQKQIALLAAGTLLFTAVSEPWAQSNFWEQRKLASAAMANSGSPKPSALGSPVEPVSSVLQGGLTRPAPLGPVKLDRFLRPLRNHPLVKSLPLSYTTVRDAYLPGPNFDRLVVHIQDVHGNPEAQENIARSIAWIQNEYGQLRKTRGESGPVLVGLEGASGAFLTPVYRSFPDKKILEEVAGAFFKRGLLTGPEYAGLTAPAEPLLWGIEDRGLYARHVGALRRSFSLEEGLGRDLDGLARRLDPLKERFYSESLKAWDKAFSAYHSQKGSLGDYVKFLSRSPGSGRYPNVVQFLEALRTEETLDFGSAEKERKELIEALASRLDKSDLTELMNLSVAFRSGQIGYGAFHEDLSRFAGTAGLSMDGFSAFARYIRYVGVVEGIDRRVILEEIESLEEACVARLLQSGTGQGRRVHRAAKDLALAKKLLEHSLTHKEWEDYQARAPHIRALPERLRELEGSARAVLPPMDAASFAQSLNPFEEFYRAGIARNQALVANLLEKMEDPPAAGSRVEAGRRALPLIAVLVAGGFHTDGMSKILRDKKTAYITLAPRFEKIEEADYLDVFRQDKTPLDKLFAGEKLTIQGDLGMQGVELGGDATAASRFAQTGFLGTLIAQADVDGVDEEEIAGFIARFLKAAKAVFKAVLRERRIETGKTGSVIKIETASGRTNRRHFWRSPGDQRGGLRVEELSPGFFSRTGQFFLRVLNGLREPRLSSYDTAARWLGRLGWKQPSVRARTIAAGAVAWWRETFQKFSIKAYVEAHDNSRKPWHRRARQIVAYLFVGIPVALALGAASFQFPILPAQWPRAYQAVFVLAASIPLIHLLAEPILLVFGIPMATGKPFDFETGAARYMDLKARMLEAVDLDDTETFRTLYREMRGLVEPLSRAARGADDARMAAVFQATGVPVSSSDPEAVKAARRELVEIGRERFSRRQQRLIDTVLEEVLEGLGLDIRAELRNAVGTFHFTNWISPEILNEDLASSEEARRHAAAMLLQLNVAGTSWGGLIPDVEKVLVRGDIEDDVALRCTLKHELIHYLAKVGLLKFPYHWEQIAYAVDVQERVARTGEDSLRRPDVVKEYGEPALFELYQRGREMGLAGETGFVVKPGVSDEEAGYFSIDLLIIEAHKVYERLGLGTDSLLEPYSAQKAVGILLGGMLTGMTQADADAKPLARLRGFFETLHARYAPPSGEDQQWLHGARGVLWELGNYASQLSGRSMKMEAKESGMWSTKPLSDTRGELHYVVTDLYPRQEDGPDAGQRRAAARERGLAHALLAVSRNIHGRRDLLPALPKAPGVEALWDALLTPRVVATALSHNSRKIESLAVAEGFDGAPRRVAAIFRDRYEVGDAWVAESLLTALPLHLQFLDTLLYRWAHYDGTSGEAHDPRLRGQRVAEAVRESLGGDEAPEAGWARIMFSPRDLSDAQLTSAVETRVLPAYRKLYAEALKQEELRRAYERMIREKIMEPAREWTDALQQMVEDYSQGLPDDVRRAIRDAAREQLERQLENFADNMMSMMTGAGASSQTSAGAPGQPAPGGTQGVRPLHSAPSSGAPGAAASLQGLQGQLSSLSEALDHLERNMEAMSSQMEATREGAAAAGSQAGGLSAEDGRGAAGEKLQENLQGVQSQARDLLRQGRDLADAADREQRQAGDLRSGLPSPEQGAAVTAGSGELRREAEDLLRQLERVQSLANQMADQGSRVQQTLGQTPVDAANLSAQVQGLRESASQLQAALGDAKSSHGDIENLVNDLKRGVSGLEKSLAGQAQQPRPSPSPAASGQGQKDGTQPGGDSAQASGQGQGAGAGAPASVSLGLPDARGLQQAVQAQDATRAPAAPAPAKSLVTEEWLRALEARERLQAETLSGLTADEQRIYDDWKEPVAELVDPLGPFTQALRVLLHLTEGMRFETHKLSGKILKHVVEGTIGEGAFADRVKARPKPVKVTLLVDKSGSMGEGNKALWARITLLSLLEVIFNLNEELEARGFPLIEFEVGFFDSDDKLQISHGTTSMLPTFHRERVIYDLLKNLEAGGGTRYYESLGRYMTRLAESPESSPDESHRMLMVITDQQVSGGELEDVRGIIEGGRESHVETFIVPIEADLAEAEAKFGTRVIDPNPLPKLPERILDAFGDNLASPGGGRSWREFIPGEEAELRLPQAMSPFFGFLYRPLIARGYHRAAAALAGILESFVGVALRFTGLSFPLRLLSQFGYFAGIHAKGELTRWKRLVVPEKTGKILVPAGVATNKQLLGLGLLGVLFHEILPSLALLAAREYWSLPGFWGVLFLFAAGIAVHVFFNLFTKGILGMARSAAPAGPVRVEGYRHFYTEEEDGRSFLVYNRPGRRERRWERGMGGPETPNLAVPDTDTNEQALVDIISSLYRDGQTFSSYSADGRFFLRPGEGAFLEVYERDPAGDWRLLVTLDSRAPPVAAPSSADLPELPEGFHSLQAGSGRLVAFNPGDPRKTAHIYQRSGKSWKRTATLALEEKQPDTDRDNRIVELQGPPGVGKGELWRAVGSLLNEEVYFMAGHEQMEVEDLSQYRTLGVERPGVSSYLPTALSRVGHFGGIVVLDEFQELPQPTENSLKEQISSDTHTWPQPTPEGGKQLLRMPNHPRARIGATSNPKPGRRDAAWGRRKVIKKVTWLPLDEEVEMQMEYARQEARNLGIYDADLESRLRATIEALVKAAIPGRLRYAGYNDTQMGQVLRDWALLKDDSFIPANALGKNLNRPVSPRVIRSLVRHYLHYPQDWKNRGLTTFQGYYTFAAEVDKRDTYSTALRDFTGEGIRDRRPASPAPRYAEESFEIEDGSLRVVPLNAAGRPSSEWDALAVPIHPDAVAALSNVLPDLLEYLQVPDNALRFHRILQAHALGRDVIYVGEQETGKTRMRELVQKLLSGPQLENVPQLTDQTTKEQITWIPHLGEGGVEFQSGWLHGPVPRSMEDGSGHGKILGMSESNQASAGLIAMLNEVSERRYLLDPAGNRHESAPGFGIHHDINPPGGDFQVGQYRDAFLERHFIVWFDPLPAEQEQPFITKASEKGDMEVNPRLIGEPVLDASGDPVLVQVPGRDIAGRPLQNADGTPVLSPQWRGLLGVEQAIRVMRAADPRALPRAPGLGTMKEWVRVIQDSYEPVEGKKPQEILLGLFKEVFSLDPRSAKEAAAWDANLKKAFKEAGLWSDEAGRDGLEDYLDGEDLIVQKLTILEEPETGNDEADRILRYLQVTTRGDRVIERLDRLEALLTELYAGWDSLSFAERLSRVYTLSRAYRILGLIRRERGPRKQASHAAAVLERMETLQDTLRTVLLLQHNWPEEILESEETQAELTGRYTLNGTTGNTALDHPLGLYDTTGDLAVDDFLGKLEVFHHRLAYAESVLISLAENLSSRGRLSPEEAQSLRRPMERLLVVLAEKQADASVLNPLQEILTLVDALALPPEPESSAGRRRRELESRLAELERTRGELLVRQAALAAEGKAAPFFRLPKVVELKEAAWKTAAFLPPNTFSIKEDAVNSLWLTYADGPSGNKESVSFVRRTDGGIFRIIFSVPDNSVSTVETDLIRDVVVLAEGESPVLAFILADDAKNEFTRSYPGLADIGWVRVLSESEALRRADLRPRLHRLFQAPGVSDWESVPFFSSMSRPEALVFDAKGAYWVTDGNKHRVHIFDAERNSLSKTIGVEGGEEGKLKFPAGVAVDPRGRVIVANSGNHRLEIYTPQDKHWKSRGMAGAAAGRFNEPHGIDFDSHGTAWVVDTGNHRVQFGDLDADTWTDEGERGSGPGQFEEPRAIAIDSQDRVWVADVGNRRLQVRDPRTGKWEVVEKTAMPVGQASRFTGLAVDPYDRIWITDSQQDFVHVYDPQHDVLFFNLFGGSGNESGKFNAPWGIAFDPRGNVWVVDIGNRRFQKARLLDAQADNAERAAAQQKLEAQVTAIEAEILTVKHRLRRLDIRERLEARLAKRKEERDALAAHSEERSAVPAWNAVFPSRQTLTDDLVAAGAHKKTSLSDPGPSVLSFAVDGYDLVISNRIQKDVAVWEIHEFRLKYDASGERLLGFQFKPGGSNKGSTFDDPNGPRELASIIQDFIVMDDGTFTMVIKDGEQIPWDRDAYPYYRLKTVQALSKSQALDRESIRTRFHHPPSAVVEGEDALREAVAFIEGGRWFPGNESIHVVPLLNIHNHNIPGKERGFGRIQSYFYFEPGKFDARELLKAFLETYSSDGLTPEQKDSIRGKVRELAARAEAPVGGGLAGVARYLDGLLCGGMWKVGEHQYPVGGVTVGGYDSPKDFETQNTVWDVQGDDIWWRLSPDMTPADLAEALQRLPKQQVALDSQGHAALDRLIEELKNLGEAEWDAPGVVLPAPSVKDRLAPPAKEVLQEEALSSPEGLSLRVLTADWGAELYYKGPDDVREAFFIEYSDSALDEITVFVRRRDLTRQYRMKIPAADVRDIVVSSDKLTIVVPDERAKDKYSATLSRDGYKFVEVITEREALDRDDLKDRLHRAAEPAGGGEAGAPAPAESGISGWLRGLGGDPLPDADRVINQPAKAVQIFPDGRRMAAVDNEGHIRLYDVATGDSLGVSGEHEGAGVGHPEGFYRLSLSSDGRFLVLHTGANKTYIYEMKNDQGRYRDAEDAFRDPFVRAGNRQAALTNVFSGDDRYLFMCDGISVHVYKIKDADGRYRNLKQVLLAVPLVSYRVDLQGITNPIVAPSADGRRLAVFSKQETSRYLMVLYDVSDPAKLFETRLSQNFFLAQDVKDAKISPDGRFLAVAAVEDGKGKLLAWELKDAQGRDKPYKHLPGEVPFASVPFFGIIDSLDFTADSRVIGLTAGPPDTLMFYRMEDSAAGPILLPVEAADTARLFKDVSFSGDNSVMAAASEENGLHIWTKPAEAPAAAEKVPAPGLLASLDAEISRIEDRLRRMDKKDELEEELARLRAEREASGAAADRAGPVQTAEDRLAAELAPPTRERLLEIALEAGFELEGGPRIEAPYRMSPLSTFVGMAALSGPGWSMNFHYQPSDLAALHGVEVFLEGIGSYQWKSLDGVPIRDVGITISDGIPSVVLIVATEEVAEQAREALHAKDSGVKGHLIVLSEEEALARAGELAGKYRFNSFGKQTSSAAAGRELDEEIADTAEHVRLLEEIEEVEDRLDVLQARRAGAAKTSDTAADDLDRVIAFIQRQKDWTYRGDPLKVTIRRLSSEEFAREHGSVESGYVSGGEKSEDAYDATLIIDESRFTRTVDLIVLLILQCGGDTDEVTVIRRKMGEFLAGLEPTDPGFPPIEIGEHNAGRVMTVADGILYVHSYESAPGQTARRWIRRYDLKVGKPLPALEVWDEVRALAVYDGVLYIATGGREILRWHLSAGRRLRSISFAPESSQGWRVGGLAVSDGVLYVSEAETNTIRRYNLKRNRRLPPLTADHFRGPTQLELKRPGEIVVRDGILYIAGNFALNKGVLRYDLKAGRALDPITAKDFGSGYQIRPGGLAASRGTIYIYDFQQHKTILEYGPSGRGTSLTPDMLGMTEDAFTAAKQIYVADGVLYMLYPDRVFRHRLGYRPSGGSALESSDSQTASEAPALAGQIAALQSELRSRLEEYEALSRPAEPNGAAPTLAPSGLLSPPTQRELFEEASRIIDDPAQTGWESRPYHYKPRRILPRTDHAIHINYDSRHIDAQSVLTEAIVIAYDEAGPLEGITLYAGTPGSPLRYNLPSRFVADIGVLPSGKSFVVIRQVEKENFHAHDLEQAQGGYFSLTEFPAVEFFYESEALNNPQVISRLHGLPMDETIAFITGQRWPVERTIHESPKYEEVLVSTQWPVTGAKAEAEAHYDDGGGKVTLTINPEKVRNPFQLLKIFGQKIPLARDDADNEADRLAGELKERMSQGGGTWIDRPWYALGMAWWFELGPAVIGLALWAAGVPDLVWPLRLVLALMAGAAAGKAFQWGHYPFHREIFKSPAVKRLAWGTAGAAGLLAWSGVNPVTVAAAASVAAGHLTVNVRDHMRERKAASVRALLPALPPAAASRDGAEIFLREAGRVVPLPVVRPLHVSTLMDPLRERENNIAAALESDRELTEWLEQLQRGRSAVLLGPTAEAYGRRDAAHISMALRDLAFELGGMYAGPESSTEGSGAGRVAALGALARLRDLAPALAAGLNEADPELKVELNEAALVRAFELGAMARQAEQAGSSSWVPAVLPEAGQPVVYHGVSASDLTAGSPFLVSLAAQIALERVARANAGEADKNIVFHLYREQKDRQFEGSDVEAALRGAGMEIGQVRFQVHDERALPRTNGVFDAAKLGAKLGSPRSALVFSTEPERWAGGVIPLKKVLEAVGNEMRLLQVLAYQA